MQAFYWTYSNQNHNTASTLNPYNCIVATTALNRRCVDARQSSSNLRTRVGPNPWKLITYQYPKYLWPWNDYRSVASCIERLVFLQTRAHPIVKHNMINAASQVSITALPSFKVMTAIYHLYHYLDPIIKNPFEKSACKRLYEYLMFKKLFRSMYLEISLFKSSAKFLSNYKIYHPVLP